MDDKIEIINTWKIGRIFSELEEGNMRIPRFQRAYVWERSKIVSLLNSIYCQFPIGTFFLWDTDKTMEGLCRDLSDFGFSKTAEANKFSFILDGQQRITSLYVALKGCTLGNVDYRTICFNLDKQLFKVPNLKTEQNNIPVWKIFDEKEYGDLIDNMYTEGQKEYAKILRNCREKLIDYPVSIVKSKNMNLDDVVTIFERINQGGKRLSLFDLVHASVWSDNFDLREKIKEFNDEKAISIFGEIDEEIFTQSLALNLKHDCTNRYQLKLETQECIENWDRTAECLRLAVDFVKDFGAQSHEILPYSNQLALLQHYFFVSNSNTMSAEIKDLIAEWFWTSTFSQRYSSSTLTKMNEEALWIQNIVSGKLEHRCFTVKLNVDDLKRVKMNTRSVIKNGILCLMALNNPIDFDNGHAVSLDKTNASRSNSKENHHFFPYSLYSKFKVTQNEINSVLNFAFITKRLNLDILNDKPSKYLSRYEKTCPDIVKFLSHHFINESAFLAAKNDNFSLFIDKRGEEILNQIEIACKVADDSVNPVNEDILDEFEE